jgi:hypothetical protein
MKRERREREIPWLFFERLEVVPELDFAEDPTAFFGALSFGFDFEPFSRAFSAASSAASSA